MKRLFFLSFLLIFFSYVFSIEKRVITLAPNLTEMIYFLGLEEHLIANTTYCNYPEEAKKMPKIGDLWNFDVEKILEYNPDFVLASFSGNSKTGVEKLESFGIKVYTLKEEKVSDILSNIAFIANLFGISADEKINYLSGKLKMLPAPSVKRKTLFLLSIKPYYSVSTNTFISDVLRLAGFDNVIASKVRYPMLSEENIAEMDFNTLIVTSRLKSEEKYLRKRLFELGKNPKIFFVDEDRISRPGPRIFDVIVELSRL
ncbi:MAG: ABC transporter substrate-binding protein [Brevinematia bacterium]